MAGHRPLIWPRTDCARGLETWWGGKSGKQWQCCHCSSTAKFLSPTGQMTWPRSGDPICPHRGGRWSPIRHTWGWGGRAQRYTQSCTCKQLGLIQSMPGWWQTTGPNSVHVGWLGPIKKAWGWREVVGPNLEDVQQPDLTWRTHSNLAQPRMHGDGMTRPDPM